jgi:hypothetical protein
MYNTKRLAGSARKAEREGRTFEAASLWGQVVTRADSLVTRHPDSKYVDEALMLKGTGLARLGQCPTAIAPLSRVTQLQGVSADAAEDAYLALARCHMELGDPASADLAASRVIESRQSARRRDALLIHAQALRLTGRPREALAALDGINGPHASEERLLALAGAGLRDQAVTTADTLLAQADSGRNWDSLLVAVGRADPRVASSRVDRLVARPGSAPATRTRWLLEDGRRLAGLDTARAEARLTQAAQAGAGTPAGIAAQVQLARRRLSRSRTSDDVAAVGRTLDSLAGESGETGEAGQLNATLVRIRSAEDSSSARAEMADLRLFLAAEAARDTLAAPVVAASLFRRLVDDWPDSPYAPKALLAARVLDTAWADTARALLDERYAASPYLAFVQGEASPEYQALEDSLQAFALRQGRAPVHAPQPGARRQPGQQPNAPGVPRRRGLEP